MTDLDDDFYDGALPDGGAIGAPEDDDDWFDAAEPEPKYGVNLPGRRRGRYFFPDPPGYVRPKGSWGFMRMTNLASGFSDQRRLTAWRERMVLLGIREDEVLFDELCAAPIERMEPDKAKKWLEDHANRAASVAKADQGARRGTARHLMLQTYLESGRVTGTRSMRLQLESLMEALAAHHLEPIPGFIERRVCNTGYHAIGTLDMGVLCQRTGQTGICDLKTQAEFWSYMECSGQQEGYDSADWWWEGPPDDRGRWVPAEPWTLMGHPKGYLAGQRVALLAHMPHEPGPDRLPVQLEEVSIPFGRRVMLQALGNVELRSIGASKAEARRIGGLRPLL